MSDNPCVVFGDVHGDLKKLKKLIALIRDRFGTDVDIVSVGDLIDRGPDSKGVIELCIKEGVVPCVGNHDFWVINMLQTGKVADVWSPIWGAWATVRSYGCKTKDPSRVFFSMRANMPQHHKDYFENAFQYCLRVDVDGNRYWITHSGISTQAAEGVKGIEVQTDEQIIGHLITWHPDQVYFGYPNLKRGELYEFENGTQVFGHQCLKQPMLEDRWIALDTGCGTKPPYTLTAIVLPSREIIQV